MVIHINPNRINTSSASGRSIARKRSQESSNDTVIAIPSRSELNYIPSPESLSTMIRSGIAALKRGIAWDRGTILNLLV